MGGRTKHYLHNWKYITKDPFILSSIQGCNIIFNEPPVQEQIPFQIQFNHKEKLALWEKIDELLIDKVIEECSLEQGDYINTVFLREKKTAKHEQPKYRIILNMKTLNKLFVEKVHHKMDSLKTVLNLMEKNCFMASIDLKNAFHTIPMNAEFTKFLKFQIDDKTYRYLVLPMGFTDSPRLFCKILKPVLVFLRKQLLLSSLYIDDFYLQGNSYEECAKNVNITLQTLKNLGFEISGKSMLKPQTELQHLGFVLNSEHMTVSLSENKREQIVDLITSSLISDSLTIRDIAIIVGTLIASFPAVEYGMLFHRELEILKINSLQGRYNFDKPVCLNTACIKQLKWWLKEGVFSGNVISHGNPDFFLQSDSSGFAWGALRLDKDTKKTQGFWDEQERQNDINVLETKAVLLGTMALCEDLHHCHLQVQVDNTTTVAYINNMGGVHTLACNDLAIKLILWCKSKHIWVSACHIAGKDNTEADKLSRKINDNTEWALDHNMFLNICHQLGTPTIDLFASRINKQLPRYMSFLPDSQATAINAFHHVWDEFAFIFPPFNLIPRVLKKIQEDRTPAAILVFPKWEGTAWYPKARRMSLKSPILLQQIDKLLYLPHKPRTIHPLMPKLRLMATILSGTN